MTATTMNREAPAPLSARFNPIGSAWVEIPQRVVADLQAVVDLFPEMRDLRGPKQDGSRFYLWAPDDTGLDISLHPDGFVIVGHNETRTSGAMGSCMSKSKVLKTIDAIVKAAKERLNPMPVQTSLF